MLSVPQVIWQGWPKLPVKKMLGIVHVHEADRELHLRRLPEKKKLVTN
jgi:hypothetical protein